jgi:patatin-like phospholipase/acyl hydrolase
MREINTSIRQQGISSNSPDVEPHEIFDLVAGTSTGGLIAIMLGKLGMGVEDCIKAYDKLSKTIFRAKHRRARLTFGLAPAKYSGSKLERCVRELLKDKGFDEELPIAYADGVDMIAWYAKQNSHVTVE